MKNNLMFEYPTQTSMTKDKNSKVRVLEFSSYKKHKRTTSNLISSKVLPDPSGLLLADNLMNSSNPTVLELNKSDYHDGDIISRIINKSVVKTRKIKFRNIKREISPSEAMSQAGK